MDEYRAGPGRVAIYRKGGKTPLQTLAFDNIVVSFNKDGSPLTNSAALYDDQGAINVGDFNFDGHEDFGVQTGNEGSYGAPSYDIYLFDPASGQFRFSRPLSELIKDSLGFFEIDTKQKRLVTRFKDGCCYHELDSYTVQSNRPVPVYREIDDATQEAGYSLVSKERMVHGKWETISSKRVRDEQDDGSK